MRAHSLKLSKPCLQALVDNKEATRADVDKYLEETRRENDRPRRRHCRTGQPSRPFGPPGRFPYRPDLIDQETERSLIGELQKFEFSPFQFHGFEGKRRVVSFGWRYDFNGGGLQTTDTFPLFLIPIRDAAAAAFGLEGASLEQALLIEYGPGASIGWHKDRPVFGDVIGVSLLSPCTFRFRRKAGQSGSGDRSAPAALGLSAAGSIAARMGAQHSCCRGAALLDHVPQPSRPSERLRTVSSLQRWRRRGRQPVDHSTPVKPRLSLEEWRKKRQAKRDKQRLDNVGRAAKMHALRLSGEIPAYTPPQEKGAGTQYFIGCSGWFYWKWRGTFYPADLPTSEWFCYYAHRFDTVEINASFYSWPTQAGVKAWLRAAGEGGSSTQ